MSRHGVTDCKLNPHVRGSCTLCCMKLSWTRLHRDVNTPLLTEGGNFLLDSRPRQRQEMIICWYFTFNEESQEVFEVPFLNDTPVVLSRYEHYTLMILGRWSGDTRVRYHKNAALWTSGGSLRVCWGGDCRCESVLCIWDLFSQLHKSVMLSSICW